jgi:hypothetical protein
MLIYKLRTQHQSYFLTHWHVNFRGFKPFFLLFFRINRNLQSAKEHVNFSLRDECLYIKLKLNKYHEYTN